MHPEKEYFLRFLANPRNLLIDVSSFFIYAGRVLKTRLYAKIKPPHTHTKAMPQWLSTEKLSKIDTDIKQAAFKDMPKDCLLHYNENLSKDVALGWRKGDPEAYWYLNRWGWLSLRFIKGSITQNETLAWIYKWILEHNDHGDPAWEPFSCSERIANLFVVINRLQVETQRTILSGVIGAFVLDSANWIIKHLEYYGNDNTNNHILNNARGLAIAAALTGNKDICGISMSIFRNMLSVIVTENGFLRERSSHYQILVSRWLFDTENALAMNKDISSDDDREFINRYAVLMAKASLLMCDSKGKLKILVGDVSPDATPDEACVFLNTLYPKWINLKEGTGLLKENDGWFFIKQGKTEVITQQPQTYPLKYSNHGHADIAGFVFLFDGRQVLIDPGRSNYTRQPLAQKFISGPFHNVPLINGLAPAVTPFFKKWTPERYGRINIEASIKDAHILTISHNGFSRLGEDIQHKRVISIADKTLIVTDEFIGKKPYDITLCWHFACGFDIETKDNDRIRLRSAEAKLSLSTRFNARSGPNPYRAYFYKASDEGGWYSPFYGFAQPALTVHVSGHLNLPATACTTFRID